VPSSGNKNMSDAIKFYGRNDKFGGFSNFYRYPIQIKGESWPTTEHYFQAMKFESEADQEEIRKAKTPMEAASKGRDRKRKLKSNWKSIRVDVMREALLAKFSQSDELLSLLISTRDTQLIEHTENDFYWGDGGDGKGENMLGQLLMEVREKLRR
jgi:ribA/ribD-fused uncharacterized protein